MNKKRFLALMPALFAVTASASDEVGHWYVSPQIGVVIPDTERSVEDGLTYGVGFGKHVSETWSLEVNALMANHNGIDATPDLDTTSLTFDGLRVFKRGATISPYLSVGLGWIQNNPSNGASTKDDVMAEVGLGAFVRVWTKSDGSKEFSIRPDIKARVDDNGHPGNMLDIVVSVGLQFGWGAPRSVAPVAVATTAAVVAPPPPPPVAAPPPPPADTDGDGVLDNRDRCPGTPRGVAVDQDGCPRKGSVTLTGVNFENNSAKLTRDSEAPLDLVATNLKTYPRLKVEVQGHTDSNGADAYNLKLSQQRADSVRNYLIGKGVAASQLTAKGYGETKPVADNKTNEGRAQNRRVALEVLENPGDVEIKK